VAYRLISAGVYVATLFLACYAPATRPDRRDGDEITAHAPKNGRLNVLPKGIRCSRHRATSHAALFLLALNAQHSY